MVELSPQFASPSRWCVMVFLQIPDLNDAHRIGRINDCRRLWHREAVYTFHRASVRWYRANRYQGRPAGDVGQIPWGSRINFLLRYIELKTYQNLTILSELPETKRLNEGITKRLFTKSECAGVEDINAFVYDHGNEVEKSTNLSVTHVCIPKFNRLEKSVSNAMRI